MGMNVKGPVHTGPFTFPRALDPIRTGDLRFRKPSLYPY